MRYYCCECCDTDDYEHRTLGKNNHEYGCGECDE